MLKHIHSEHIRHFIRSTTIYQEHSPFFYIFWKNVLLPRLPKVVEQNLIRSRRQLLKNKTPIKRIDHGAGSRLSSKPNTIQQVAKSSLSPTWLVTILYYIRSYYKLQNCLELGTSLGLSSSALQQAMPKHPLVTIEGDPSIAAIARSVHRDQGLSNIKVIEGLFSSALPSVLRDLETVDLCFIDGHHDGQATIEYFNTILPCMAANGIMVFDDIFWSKDMTNAFVDIRCHPGVKASILYRGVGFIFLADNWPEPIHLDWVDRVCKPWTYFASL